MYRPRPLELTAADELTAIENLPILRANGFEVDIDEEKPPGRGERVKLVAMPVSKETVFDFKGGRLSLSLKRPLTADLEQLLHLLSDSAHASGQMVRCTKARNMFAMRACRKSVMIGRSLTKGQMTQVSQGFRIYLPVKLTEQLLRNMATIDQPWVGRCIRFIYRSSSDWTELSAWSTDDEASDRDRGEA
jgi:DNA mismatch repair protein PMS2